MNMHKFVLRILPQILLLLAQGVNTSNTTEEVYCEFYNRTMCAESKLNGGFNGCGEIKSCGATVSPSRYSCYAILSKEENFYKFTTYMKGCTLNDSCYNKSDCTIKIQRELRQPFCCCDGNLCNKNTAILLSRMYEDIAAMGSDFYVKVVTFFGLPTSNNKPEPALMWMLVTCMIMIFLFAFSIICYQLVSKNNMQSKRESTLIVTQEVEVKAHIQHNDDSVLDLNRIQLIEEKASGQFGTLWKAVQEDKEVAVKIFTKEHKKAWMIEKNIFKPTIRDHPNIIQIFGIGIKPSQEYWLITEYHPLGSLRDYLIDHTVSWEELCLIAETMTRGLAFLHDLDYTGSNKPMIAHRDFKSTSVLLKNDLTACITDFASAIAFNDDAECVDKYFQSGTKRYMAPEVLEGAILLRPTSFLRTDMYACALVLWELVSRCTAFCGPVLEYKLPYEEQVGKSPNLEDMKLCVLQKKVRPTIQEAWKNHSGLDELCTTIEECWDYEADARLTAACVLERIVTLAKTELNKDDFVVVDVEDGLAIVNESIHVHG